MAALRPAWRKSAPCGSRVQSGRGFTIDQRRALSAARCRRSRHDRRIDFRRSGRLTWWVLELGTLTVALVPEAPSPNTVEASDDRGIAGSGVAAVGAVPGSSVEGLSARVPCGGDAGAGTVAAGASGAPVDVVGLAACSVACHPAPTLPLGDVSQSVRVAVGAVAAMSLISCGRSRPPKLAAARAAMVNTRGRRPVHRRAGK
jgi:hypothetical protein